MDNNLRVVWKDKADHEEYESARVGRVFNHRRPTRLPIAIAEPKDEAQILQAVKLAISLNCRVSVRSGGHSWAAWSVRDEALLIDLGKWNYIAFDENSMVATVSPSTTGRMLNKFLSERGYMFPGGHCPDVGLGGFLLQGGMGWNCKVRIPLTPNTLALTDTDMFDIQQNWGWACENIVALDVVTANGELIHVDEHHHQDLFFAARGAGPGFPGVITKFHLKVRKSYSSMLGSTFIYPIARYDEVLDWVIKISPDFDDGTEIVAVSAVPPGMTERCIIAHFVVFKHTEAESQEALSPANRGRPDGCLVEIVNEPTSLAQEYVDQDKANPEGYRYCAENGYVKNDEDVVGVLREAFTTPPHPKSFCLWFAMAPCSRRTLPDMALSMQTDHYFAAYTVWEDEQDDKRCQTWTREVMKNIAPHCAGSYMGDFDFQVRQTKFWTDDKAKKLMEIRRRRDPDGRICGYLDAGDASGVNGLENEERSFEAIQCNGNGKSRI
ncbi:FAD binding domain protein [Fusarium beomiforme]|uniref:FAD binding domain protein n=1 Tax=Fusarium beomiforme TaxID=44412 RepID=A0A9P5DXI0_9HYPO|nr:FAD binding domain protein [Fusarium beomiforme]